MGRPLAEACPTVRPPRSPPLSGKDCGVYCAPRPQRVVGWGRRVRLGAPQGGRTEWIAAKRTTAPAGAGGEPGPWPSCSKRLVCGRGGLPATEWPRTCFMGPQRRMPGDRAGWRTSVELWSKALGRGGGASSAIPYPAPRPDGNCWNVAVKVRGHALRPVRLGRWETPMRRASALRMGQPVLVIIGKAAWGGIRFMRS